MIAEKKHPQSWGRYPHVKPERVVSIHWRNELPDLNELERPVLPYGHGRSYGDSCLNDGGVSLDLTRLRHFIAFDDEQGLLRCEAGVTLADVLELAVPRGWFLPTSPGTKFVTIGGAIANDVHGKNHHVNGTLGCHVTRFELLRSNGERLLCSPAQNSELFRATIGGLGLTGIILWAEIRLKPIVNPYLDTESIRFESLDEFFELSTSSDHDYEYSVSWVDLLVGGKALCRGKFSRGNHNQDLSLARRPLKKKRALAVPIDFPTFVLNKYTVKAFNELYYSVQREKKVTKISHYEPFFYPLDVILEWNRIYGKNGFFQYQFVVPFSTAHAVMDDVLKLIRASGEGSFLTVLKTFGEVQSPGMLSFPRPGLTLALDFTNRGDRTLKLMEDMDTIIRQSGGVVYPAKDARMSPESFQLYYPQWREFEKYIDPQFSSTFWRRVTAGSPVPLL